MACGGLFCSLPCAGSRSGIKSLPQPRRRVVACLVLVVCLGLSFGVPAFIHPFTDIVVFVVEDLVSLGPSGLFQPPPLLSHAFGKKEESGYLSFVSVVRIGFLRGFPSHKIGDRDSSISIHLS
jgi:hypothetical protein